MSLGGGEQLAREVKELTQDWQPDPSNSREYDFQEELASLLREELNSSSGGLMGMDMGLGGSREIVVEREHGTVNGDIAVDESIGLELKYNLTNSQTKKLRGQIESYQREYDFVLVVACGLNDQSGWQKLKRDYENQMNMMQPDSAQVGFVAKRL